MTTRNYHIKHILHARPLDVNSFFVIFPKFSRYRSKGGGDSFIDKHLVHRGFLKNLQERRHRQKSKKGVDAECWFVKQKKRRYQPEKGLEAP